MTRVSENSSAHSLKYSINKTKQRMEDLQLRGSTLKSMSKPSDNPVSNVEVMQLKSLKDDNNQYIRNSDFALMHLNVTEKSLEELTNILVKAKEIAIAQASDLYNPEVRKNIANEVIQLRNLALSIANKRIGNKYIFGGYNTLESPFAKDGSYRGDNGHITLEVAKDFFVQTNLHGAEVFYADEEVTGQEDHPLEKFPNMESSPRNIKDKTLDQNRENIARDIASETQVGVEGNEVEQAPLEEKTFSSRENLFSLLEGLSSALENDDSQAIQNLLERYDTAISRLITLRTRAGSIISSIQTTKNTIESDNIDNEERRSKLADADIAELFSELTKQKSILETSYKSTQGLINTNLLDYLR